MNKKLIFFNRQNGIIYGSIAWIIAFCSFNIAIALFKKIDPSYSIFTHHLSDLGAGRNFSNIMLFIGLTLTSIFQILFHISFGIRLKQKENKLPLIKIAMGTAIISLISLIMVTPFTSNPEIPVFNIAHGILGGIHFGIMAFAFLFYGIIELSNPLISNKFTIISFNSAFLYGLNCIFPHFYIIYWLAIAGAFLWLFVHIVFLIRAKEYK